MGISTLTRGGMETFTYRDPCAGPNRRESRSDPNWRVTCGRISAAKVARSLTGVAFPTNVSFPICQRTKAFVAQEIHAGGVASQENTQGQPRNYPKPQRTSHDPFRPNPNRSTH